MAHNVVNWKTFVEAGRTFFEANRGCPMYQLVDHLDELYRLAYLKAPFPKTGGEQDNFLHMCFLICHRALLSAATVLSSGQPEDGPAITRRAIEAAKVCLAVKADASNFEEWKNIETRKTRWESRSNGEKPKTFTPAYKATFTEPLYADLQSVIGTLSDFSVHFTPEHLLGYEWAQTSRLDGGTDNSFGVTEDRVQQEFLMLADQHRLILRVFDRCLDGKLFDHPDIKQRAQLAMTLYKELLQQEGFTEEATAVGETW